MKRNLGVVVGLVTALVLLLGINLIASIGMRNVKLDLTEEKLYTLSPGSKQLIDKVKDQVRLKLFYSKTAANAAPGIKQYADRVIELLRQYANISKGKITLEILDPRPDTDIEEAAVKYGLKAAPLANRENFYFGLVIENEVGDQQSIPFLDVNRENFLEYDITRLISAVSTPKKKVIGIMSALPMMGGYGGDPMARLSGRPPGEAWVFVEELKNSYEVKEIAMTAKEIDSTIDLLMVVHPKAITPATEYAIDQYLMRGGRAVVMVDPLSFVDQANFSSPNPQDRFQANFDSNLPTLLPSWGLELVPAKVAGDLNLATKVSFGQRPGDYPNALSLTQKNLSQKEIISANLENVFMVNAGILKKQEGARYELTPLAETTTGGGEIDAFMLKFGGDADSLRKEFKPSNQKLGLIWKLTGKLVTAFPAGKPASTTPPDPKNPEPEKPMEHLAEAKEPTSIVIFSDVDMLSDPISVDKRPFLGQTIARLINDNLSIVNNAVENLLGAQELIGLRARGKSIRPFTRVDELEKQAQAHWADEEKSLNTKLEETQRKLRELQSGKAEGQRTVLNASQMAQIETFKADQLQAKKRLTEVRRNLRQDIEKLGVRLKFINIALVPIIVFLLSFLPVAWRSFRMR